MKKIKLIALDLDGTLLNKEHRLSDRTIEVWNKVKKDGIHIIPITGRPLVAMHERIIPRSLYEYTINANGVHVFKMNNNIEEIIWDKSLSWNEAQPILDFLGSTYPHIFTQVYVGQDIYALQQGTHTEEYASRTGLVHNIIDSWDDIAGNDIVKIMAINEHEALLPIAHKLHDHDTIHAVFSNPSYLEIFSKSASKGDAILFLAQQLGIDASEMLGVGDSYNDVSMLEVCGHAYVMKNAEDAVAPHLPRTKFTNDEDGVAKLLEELL